MLLIDLCPAQIFNPNLFHKRIQILIANTNNDPLTF